MSTAGVAGWREALAGHRPTVSDDAAPGATGATGATGAMVWQVTIEDVVVSIEVRSVSDDVGELRVSVPLSETVAGLRVMRPAHALSQDGRIETGDAALDACVWIFAKDIALMGAFGKNTRRLLVELIGRGLMVDGGWLRLEPWATVVLEEDAIVETLTRMARLAKALVVPKGQQPYVRIAKIAADDPDLNVRSAFARLTQSSPEVRAANARLAVKQAVVADDETFDALVTLVGRKGTPAQVVREAWVKLVALFPLPRLLPLFETVTKGVAEVIMTQLVASADGSDTRRPAIAVALHLLTSKRAKPEPEVAARVAKVFEVQRFAEAIPWLVETLERKEAKAAQGAALSALMVMGVPAERTIDQLGGVGRAYATQHAPAVAVRLAEAKRPIGPLFGALFELVTPVGRSLYGLDTELRGQILAYLRAFGQLGDAAYAEQVRAFVSDSGDEEVQLAAIEVLGAVGTGVHLAVLEPLRKGFFRSGSVKSAAGVASAMIRNRSPQLEEGALALTEDGVLGGLAVADEEGGHE